MTPSRMLMLWTLRTFCVSSERAAQGKLGKLMSRETLGREEGT